MVLRKKKKNNKTQTGLPRWFSGKECLISKIRNERGELENDVTEIKIISQK